MIPGPGQLLFLGTGTSYGVPMIGCGCGVCHSTDARDRRLRCSALLNAGGSLILIDVSPDFREQALRAGLDRLDAVIITHVHADHVFGLDDLRPLSLDRSTPLDVYTDAASAAKLRQVFDYVFASEAKRPGIPWLKLVVIEPLTRFTIGDSEFELLPLRHGLGMTNGVRHDRFAYLTDFKTMDDRSFERLRGVEVLALDMLRFEPHATHLCLSESLAVVERLARPETWFIHMGHEVDHAATQRSLPSGVTLAHDGLVIEMARRTA